jgi:hypothetical protein
VVDPKRLKAVQESARVPTWAMGIPGAYIVAARTEDCKTMGSWLLRHSQECCIQDAQLHKEKECFDLLKGHLAVH